MAEFSLSNPKHINKGKEIDKKPFPGSNGFKDAEREPDAIRALWKLYPGPLCGVPTGEVSGIDVLDIDVKDGAQGMVWFLDWYDRLPETRVHRTQSGGLHILLKHLPGLRNSASKIASGVDVRADGGYCVWWPLERYQAHGSLDALAEWPLWLLPSLMSTPVPPPPPYPKATARPFTLGAVEGVLKTVATAPQGQRNALVYWGAHRLKEVVAEGKISATDGRVRGAGQADFR
jgi:hypothetical protein